MRIQEIQYHDKDSDWQLASTEFFQDLTLLVGVSGVGKTRILRAVSALRDIAEGDDDEFFWGVHWKTQFVTDDGSEYCWSGTFQERESSNDGSDVDDDLSFVVWRHPKKTKPRPKVLDELLSKNGQPIIERENGVIRLHGKPTPKLSPYESAVKILSEEDDVSSVHNAFKQVLSVDHSEDSSPFTPVPGFEHLCAEFDTLEKIRNCKYSTKIKLGLVHENDRATFDRIMERFKDVFPQVQEVDIRRMEGLPIAVLQIRIKEQGVGKWIPEHKISSGMFRTLLHLSRMILWPDGMVVLIDEFENSLGVNCLDFVTNDLVAESDRLQFIITSHHPYIINNIDTQHWKIVVRDGSIVSTRDASEFGIDDSSHEAFIKLMNLPQYREGIAVE